MANERIAILEGAGFRYSFFHECYVNMDRRQVISIEALDYHTLRWLRHTINRPLPDGEWTFDFLTEPSPSAKNQVIERLTKHG